MNSSDETDATDADTDEDDQMVESPPVPLETDALVDDVKKEATSEDAVSALLSAAAADVVTSEMMGSDVATSETASDGVPEHVSKEEDINGGTVGDEASIQNGEKATEMTANPVTDDLRDEKPEQFYSTRGRDRYKEEDVRIAPEEPIEKETNNSATVTSFLEDLTGHERLTRTRFLPDVEGIHSLRKSEIKSDLSLARAMVSSLGVAGQVSSKRSRKSRPSGSNHGRDENQMDADDDAGGMGLSDEDMEDVSVHSSKLDYCLTASSKAFLAPPDVNNGDELDGKRNQPTRPPHVVEVVTAYNPPRPPESIGPKKKHRMLRWERKPQDVEIDLSNYRKTVQRTREELHNAEYERERIESIGAAIQSSYLAQLEALNQEGRELNKELGRLHQKCIKSADLLSSRTRSRGGGKGTHVMKDVFAILKARGVELGDHGISFDSSIATANVTIPPGIGGVCAQSFVDWSQSTDYSAEAIASAWILPGDRVATPYGEGSVVHVYGPCVLDVSSAPLPGAAPCPAIPVPTELRRAIDSERKPDSKHGFGASELVSAEARRSAASTPSGEVLLDGKAITSQEKGKDVPTKKSPSKKAIKKNSEKSVLPPVGTQNHEHVKENVLSPRICVQLPFGIGFFAVNVVTSKEDPSSYSDTKLAMRWKKMIDSAPPVGTCLDVAVMETIGFTNVSDKPAVTDDDGMDVDDEPECSQSSQAAAAESENGRVNNDAATKRFVPFASGILPTSIGRGGLVPETDISALESAMKKPVFDGYGVLGMRENQGLPKGFREWEDTKCELSVLRAIVLQRRNELHRQRRIKHLNMRALATTNERSLRVEALVHEMRTDLKSLKDRLDDELVELQLSSELAESLLSSFYRAQDKTKFCTTDATPPKRRRTGKEGSESVSPARRVPVDAAAVDNMDANTEEDDDDEQLEAVHVGTSLIQSMDDSEKDRPNKRSRPSAQ